MSITQNHHNEQAATKSAAFIRPAPLPVGNSTHPFWLHPTSEANPLANVGSEGPLTNDADICIIGSGLSGVSAAYHISKLMRDSENDDLGPLKMVIFEARDFCSGATGRNGGHLTPAAFKGLSENLRRYGADQALKQLALEHHTVADLVQILKDLQLQESVDLISGGHIDLFLTEKEVDDAMADYEAAEGSGADLEGVQWRTREYMLNMHGTDHPAVGIPGYNIWPIKLVTQLYHLAHNESLKSGRISLDLHTNTPVTNVTSSNKPNRRWSIQTHRGSTSCQTVLHATNGYASHLLPHMAGPEGILPRRGQIIATRANVSAEKLTRAGWGSHEGPARRYWFPRPLKSGDNNTHPLVILGGGRENTGPGFEHNETDDSVLNKSVSKALRETLPVIFPGMFVPGTEPEFEWTGIMGYTKLGDPFVGPIVDPFDAQSNRFKGQYISAGFSGHGMPRTYACSQVVAQLILHELTGKPRDTWTPPEWLPNHYLTWARPV